MYFFDANSVLKGHHHVQKKILEVGEVKGARTKTANMHQHSCSWLAKHHHPMQMMLRSTGSIDLWPISGHPLLATQFSGLSTGGSKRNSVWHVKFCLCKECGATSVGDRYTSWPRSIDQSRDQILPKRNRMRSSRGRWSSLLLTQQYGHSGHGCWPGHCPATQRYHDDRLKETQKCS